MTRPATAGLGVAAASMLALVALLPAAGTALTWRSLQAGVDYTVISRADA